MKNRFEEYWGTNLDEVESGAYPYSYGLWFKRFEEELGVALEKKSFKKDTAQEKARFKCLAYMAVSSMANENTPRDMVEKTYPQFNLAIFELQKHFEPFGLMLRALHKKYFLEEQSKGKTNVEAVKIQKALFKKHFEESFVPKSAKLAKIEIAWDA